MSLFKSTLVAMLVLGIAACGRSETANDQASTGTTVEVNTQAADSVNSATPTDNKGMPVPGTNTTEKEVHDMNDMGNMDMNHMNHM